MKTSTKIFIGAAVVAVAICTVNVISAGVQHKKLDPIAAELAAQLERTDIRVVSYQPSGRGDMGNIRYFFSRDTGREIPKRLNLSSEALKTARISGDTLLICKNRPATGQIFTSPTLETVIVRSEGGPDKVMNYRPEPAPDPEPAAGEPENRRRTRLRLRRQSDMGKNRDRT